VSIEKHYTSDEVAALLHLCDDTVRTLFRNEPGVLRLGHEGRREGNKRVRRYFRLRIPESVVLRVQARLADVNEAWEANRKRLVRGGK
jgi:hypothetical protein